MWQAAVRGRARAAHQGGRAAQHMHASDLELVSLVLTHVQHWRGPIIAARARAPRCAYRHVQGMSEAPRELRDSVSVTQRVAEHSNAT